jgi:hypothetical protein
MKHLGVCLIIVVTMTMSSYAEDKPREYREGSYCKEISYVDTSSEGVEGTLECQPGTSFFFGFQPTNSPTNSPTNPPTNQTTGGSVGMCMRHAECIKKNGALEERSGCQSLYIRDALNDNKGIYNKASCELYCTEIRPDLPVVSYRRSQDNRICCACSSRGYPGQYCHSETKCVIGASFCCEGSGAISIKSVHLGMLSVTLLLSIFINT